MYIENILNKLREEGIGEIKVNGMLVQMLCFIDDIAMIAGNQVDLSNMQTKINDNCNVGKNKHRIE